MKTVLKGVKITLEFESIEFDETDQTINLIDSVSNQLRTLIKQSDEIQQTINEKL